MLLLSWDHHTCSEAMVYPPTAGAQAWPMKGAHREEMGHGVRERPWEAGVLVGSPDSWDGDNIPISVPRDSTWPLSCSKGGHNLDMTKGRVLHIPLHIDT